MRTHGPWLGQVPLILGPSSWGSPLISAPVIFVTEEDLRRSKKNKRILSGSPRLGQNGTPPYYGQWGLRDGSAGGTVGPFDSIEEAFEAATAAVVDAGAKALPTDGFAQVKDAQGNAVGPVT